MKRLALLLGLCATPLSAQRPPAVIHIEERHSGLLDSLYAVIGAWPQHVSITISPRHQGSTTLDRILLAPTADREAVFHEFAHYWSIVRSLGALAVSDSLGINPFTRRGNEDLAGVLVQALKVSMGTLQPTARDALVLRLMR